MRTLMVLIGLMVICALGLESVAMGADTTEKQDKGLKIGYRTQAYGRMEFGEALRDLKRRGYGGSRRARCRPVGIRV